MSTLSPTKRVAIYARVSTDDKGQDPENQLRQLRAWCDSMGYAVAREYVEHESGGKSADHRKQLAQVFGFHAGRAAVMPACSDQKP